MPDPDVFAARHWGRVPLHTPAAELNGAAADLFSPAAVDELLSRRGLRTPFLRVAKEGSTLGDRDFTAPGGAGATVGDQLSDDKLLALFAAGSTLVLQGLHRTWAPLLDLAQDLGAELGHPVQVNGYVTPAQNRGFDDHYDVHDVLVLQVSGRKHWRVRPPVHPHPLRDQPWTDHRAAVAAAAERPPELDVVLEPGDTLYVPRGWLHSATALGGSTVHLTLGVHTWTRHHLLTQLVAEAVAGVAADEQVRAALPLGVDVTRVAGDDLERVRALLLQAVSDVAATAVAGRMAGAARSAQRAAPLAPLATLAAAQRLAEGDHVWLRGHLVAELEPAVGGGFRVRSRAGLLELGATEQAGVRALLEHGSVPVGELGVGLARRLLLAGVAVAG